MTEQTRRRRSQEERTAETREALIDAAIAVIHQAGYPAASTALIAAQAGVSRGAILHQFGTRAMLMAEVVAEVYRREAIIYEELVAQGLTGQKVQDWPAILLDVLDRPAGVAVLEILQASRSDPELAELVRNRQADVEDAALATVQMGLGGGRETALAVMRLMVWSVRGLSIANLVMPTGIDTRTPVALLSSLLSFAAPSGRIDELEPLLARFAQSLEQQTS
ncbi:MULTISPECIES: TetR/AcrR family transcriptional regulator [unclassified Novosphingobium]|uniref:TetR/AcrR family transcriptional regulator n=1 Tax=Novosphingobium TaxID=165696 RepID=UPI001444A7C8|nr:MULTISPECIES: TetR/AcrR family transcriptional regulator [unclassified Novosphingobium]NKJ40672.1 AcrR family transcriptional regulator [Novosphingobium sp. SG720]NMN05036.1 AcrR family transcriptional regulator [Novosphingobium sp. SG919]NMN87330.1 AcrR family transcriptional regulator [Novosphingobium sp. SG916]